MRTQLIAVVKSLSFSLLSLWAEGRTSLSLSALGGKQITGLAVQRHKISSLSLEALPTVLPNRVPWSTWPGFHLGVCRKLALVPKDNRSSSLLNLELLPCLEKGFLLFACEVKFGILGGRDHPCFSRGVLKGPCTLVFARRAAGPWALIKDENTVCDHRGGGDGRGMAGRQPRNASSHQTWKEQGTASPLQPPQGARPC